MTQQHPITLPPELVLQWMQEFNDPQHCHWEEYETGIATRAAQWGYGQCLKEYEAAMCDLVPPPSDFES